MEEHNFPKNLKMYMCPNSQVGIKKKHSDLTEPKRKPRYSCKK
jgi:hypothetical protein